MSKCLIFNKLVLNLDETNIIKFITVCDLKIGYDDKYIEESINTKFLGLQIDNHLNWKNHIDLMIPKLSIACYAGISVFHISNTDTTKSIYFTYFHSIMKYGIIFWGNSPNSKMIISLWKRTGRIVVGVKSRNSCQNLFYLFHVNIYLC
jgi:hypothetical protein